MQQIPILNANGKSLPRMAFGTHSLKGQICREMVGHAIDNGIRFLDTAAYYENEEDVGQAIKSSSVSREEIIVGTKVWRKNISREGIVESAEASLKRLGLDYIDVLYPHWHKASTSAEDMMAGFQTLIEAGKIRAVGMSNFNISMMEEVMATGVQPVIANQLEFHPYLGQRDLYEALRNHPAFRDYNLAVIAYSPLANGRVPKDQDLIEIGKKYGKSAAQTSLRWILQKDSTIALFRAQTLEELKEDMDIFDFNLSAEDMVKIDHMTLRQERFYEHPSMRKKWDSAQGFAQTGRPSPDMVRGVEEGPV